MKLHSQFFRSCGWAAAFCLSLVAQTPEGADRTVGVNSQTRQVDVREGTVVYVAGNDLVVKMQDGTIKHFVVPSDQTFNIDDKEEMLAELKPGTRLMQVVATTTRNLTVASIRNVDLKVIQALPTHLNVQGADGKQLYLRVPEGTTFEVEGKEMRLSDLRDGMRIKGTVVTKVPETLVTKTKALAAADPIETPKLAGVLLIQEETEIKPQQ
jgi:hypothetical protein